MFNFSKMYAQKGVLAMSKIFNNLKRNTRMGILPAGIWGFLISLILNALLFNCIYKGIIAYSSEIFAAPIGVAIFFLMIGIFFPLFVERRVFVAFISAMLISSVIFGLLGKNLSESYIDQAKLARSQGALEGRTCNVEGALFRREGKGKFKIVEGKENIPKTTCYLSREEETVDGFVPMVKIRLNHPVTGKDYWSPVDQLEKPDEEKTDKSAGFWGKFKPKTSEVNWTPKLIASHNRSVKKDRLWLVIPGFKRGDLVEFKEDFVVLPKKEKQQVVLFTDCQRRGVFMGNKIPRGTRFRVTEKSGLGGAELLICSVGSPVEGFGKLQLIKKVN